MSHLAAHMVTVHAGSSVQAQAEGFSVQVWKIAE